MEQTTLPSLIEKIKELEAQEKAADDQGCEVPESVYWEKQIYEKLLAGKIDTAVELRIAVLGRIDGLKRALKNTQDLLDRLEQAFHDAVSLSASKRLDGESFSAKLQTNSKGSVIIEDQSKIPIEFKNLDVCVTSKFAATDLKEKRFWTSVILKRPVKQEELDTLSAEDQVKVSECMTEYVSKPQVETVLKTNPNGVPGAKLVKGQHLRFGDSNGKLLTKG